MDSTVRRMPGRMSAEESQTRCDLAACYRLVDLFGWSDLVNTRITARVPGQHDHFLINPYGLLFDEVTASSLVKIDAEGNKVEPSDSVIIAGAPQPAHHWCSGVVRAPTVTSSLRWHVDVQTRPKFSQDRRWSTPSPVPFFSNLPP